jgi:hypothetical protein
VLATLISLGFDQATLGLMAAWDASLIPLLDLTSGILADRWSRKGVLILASVAFVLFALIFGAGSQHAGIFHAGWLVVGVTLLASVLLVKVALGQDFKGLEASDEPSSSGAA